MVKECKRCNGTGSIDCVKCYGKSGWIKNEFIDCDRCAGTREQKCPNCCGTGELYIQEVDDKNGK